MFALSRAFTMVEGIFAWKIGVELFNGGQQWTGTDANLSRRIGTTKVA